MRNLNPTIIRRPSQDIEVDGFWDYMELIALLKSQPDNAFLIVGDTCYRNSFAKTIVPWLVGRHPSLFRWSHQ
jgi:hypothetical protein